MLSLELRYVVAGVLLALGPPLGLLVLRAVVEGIFPTIGWVRLQLVSDPLLWTYLLFCPMLVLGLAGWITGRRVHALQVSAETDALTGLYNRRSFEARVEEALAFHRRRGRPMALLLLDLDRLKEINDQGGHGAGDEAIRAVGRALRAACRARDVAARIGGDEFAVLVWDADAAVGIAVAERVRTKLRAAIGRPATVSIGVTSIEDGPTPHARAFFDQADAALYKAKAEGRDRIVLG